MSLLDRLWPRRPPVRTADPATIRAFFNEAAADEEHYPSTIDPRILHVKVVLEHLGDLNGKRVATGPGRSDQWSATDGLLCVRIYTESSAM